MRSGREVGALQIVLFIRHRHRVDVRRRAGAGRERVGDAPAAGGARDRVDVVHRDDHALPLAPRRVVVEVPERDAARSETGIFVTERAHGLRELRERLRHREDRRADARYLLVGPDEVDDVAGEGPKVARNEARLEDADGRIGRRRAEVLHEDGTHALAVLGLVEGVDPEDAQAGQVHVRVGRVGRGLRVLYVGDSKTAAERVRRIRRGGVGLQRGAACQDEKARCEETHDLRQAVLQNPGARHAATSLSLMRAKTCSSLAMILCFFEYTVLTLMFIERAMSRGCIPWPK